ncbi:MAG: cold-shock protein [Actinomycetota bacterium]|nr:MAG: cold-shock protein [Actinomycetota bacterium]
MQVNPLTLGISRGIVTQFDRETGLGIIACADGTELRFHCIAITDGSRSVEVGASVCFRVFPGMKGNAEAGVVEKL